VYEAEQQFLGRTVAVKTLHGMFARKPEIVARFQNEALAAARVRNPHIVELLDLGRLDDGALFIAMEMLHGRELSRLLREGPLPIGRAVRIAMQLYDTLIDVHAAGIIHRDLKPANIFLVRSGTDEDFVKVLDFGISKVTEAEGTPDFTRTRSVLGTPHYMAPEQIGNARKVDARSDLYAVGGILYRALVGRTAFTEKEFTERVQFR
jgi:serine/threonine protein kinase